MYLSSLDIVELVSMDIDGQPRPDTSLQDALGFLCLKQTLVTEDINVLHLQLPLAHQLLDPGDLDLDDIPGSLLYCHSSRDGLAEGGRGW